MKGKASRLSGVVVGLKTRSERMLPMPQRPRGQLRLSRDGDDDGGGEASMRGCRRKDR